MANEILKWLHIVAVTFGDRRLNGHCYVTCVHVRVQNTNVKRSLTTLSNLGIFAYYFFIFLKETIMPERSLPSSDNHKQRKKKEKIFIQSRLDPLTTNLLYEIRFKRTRIFLFSIFVIQARAYLGSVRGCL